MPSTPSFVASFVRAAECPVSYVPVPAITVARPPTSSTATRKRSSFSASLSVGDSPVVPQTTSPSEPFSTRNVASSRNRSKSTAPSTRNGVTIAVITEPSMCVSLRELALQLLQGVEDALGEGRVRLDRVEERLDLDLGADRERELAEPLGRLRTDADCPDEPALPWVGEDANRALALRPTVSREARDGSGREP